MIISGIEDQADRPRLLIVEPDAATARRMLEALGRTCVCFGELDSMTSTDDPKVCRCGRFRETGNSCETGGAASAGETDASCVIARTLAQLRTLDYQPTDVVVCAWRLPDGSGLEALAHMQATSPSLPVILVGPPNEDQDAVTAIRAGAFDVIATTDGNLAALPLAVEKCRVRNQHLREMLRQLEMMARTDELTGLANRRWLDEMLKRAWDEAVRSGRPLAFLMIDLDGFKVINDTFGHREGDVILERTGRIIQANCRHVDLAARYGGDEFCVLMPECEAHDAARVALRILDEHEHAHRRRSDDRRASVGISVGVAQIDVSRPVSAEQLVQHADEALYAAKTAGKRLVMVRTGSGCMPTADFSADVQPAMAK